MRAASRLAFLLAAAALTSACVLVGGKPYFVWGVPRLPPVSASPRCEPMHPGSGALVRVHVVDDQDLPLAGMSVHFVRGSEPRRTYVTDTNGNADAWIPAGAWTVRTEPVADRWGEGAVDVAEDQFCEMTFRIPLEHTIED
ncbi:MAG TPA: hypothetical protein VH854_00730 [Thermoanaerobaculia bacterium]|jgi:hypothetical protein|nr:hypothetical protein [Thermoanaerobaculia bacterium]